MKRSFTLMLVCFLAILGILATGDFLVAAGLTPTKTRVVVKPRRSITGSPKVFSRKAEKVDVSPVLRSIPVDRKGLGKIGPFPVLELFRPDVEFKPNWNLKKPPSKDAAAYNQDPSIPVVTMPPPILTFEGQSINDDFLNLGFGVLPPDTVGDVGPNHYVQAVNLVFAVYDKSGNIVLQPTPMNALWAGFGGMCETNNDGDVLVLYDELADRWFLTQFAISPTAGGSYHECIAVSQTGDPTGAYYRYDFLVSNLPGQTNTFWLNDYPHFGIWPDAYYMTDRQFDLLNGTFEGCGSFAFDRKKMLVGDPTASFIYINTGPITNFDDGLLPADFDGTPPPLGSPGLFAIFTADEFGAAADTLRIFEFVADFVTPGNSTFTERPESPIPVAAFDPTLNECDNLTIPCLAGVAGCTQNQTARDDIPQPPPALNCHYLDSHGLVRLLHRVQYRNSGGFDTLTMSHTVDYLSSPILQTQSHAGAVRYYKLRRDGTGPFVVDQQLSYGGIAPPVSFNSNHRWEPSAATDNSGNTAVGYSLASTIRYPTIRYFGVTNAGTVLHENQIVAGSDSQTHVASRWGDYASMNVDPVDQCTFWFTTEYFVGPDICSGGTTACWQTRVGAFKFPNCSPAALGVLNGTVTDAVTGNAIAGALITAIGSDGHEYSTTTNASGFYTRLLPADTYTVTASAAGYVDQTVVVTIAAGQTLTRDFALVPTNAADVSVSKSDEPDPVTAGGSLMYHISVNNNGPANATNVTVTDTLPSQVAFVSATPDQGTCAEVSGVITCNLGTIAAGATVMIHVQVNAVTAGDAVNEACASASEGDPDQTNNCDTENTTIEVSCLYCDDFNDGVLPNWTFLKPSWTETGGFLVGTPVRKAVAVATPAFGGCMNCSSEAGMRTAGGTFNKIWMLFQYQNKSNTIEVLLKEENDKVIIKQRVGGIIVAKANAPFTILPNQTYIVKVAYNGSQYTLSMDGNQILTLNPGGPVSSGTVGFQVKNTTGSFDYILVNP